MYLKVDNLLGNIWEQMQTKDKISNQIKFTNMESFLGQGP